MQISSCRSRFLGFSLLATLLAGCTPTQSANPGAKPQATAPLLPAARQVTQPQPPPPSPAAQAPPSAQQQRARVLIQQVEQAYAQGQTAYHKGDLVSAKVDFDRAVDLMLESGIDIKADSQLQDEFDHIVDGVNALEMESLKQGNGFVPKEEPTPAEVASDVTFEVDPNIVAKARADLATTKSDLPLMVNEYVAAYINFFAYTQKGHNTLLHSFQRAGRYRAMIQRVMAEEGVPQDLIYLAVAESGFNPRAINPRSRAGGMWQFMPTGSYGLARNGYVDERFDPEKSTRAYARYMKFIYDQLGDWYLSMAGYDWGAGNIQRAVQKTGYADFWELYKRNNLPGETKNYVPEILAAIIIANNPTQYGFDDVTLDPPVLTDTVTINYSVDLRLVAEIVDAPVDELTALNPSLLRMVTPPDSPFDLHLPAGTATLYEQRIGIIPEARRAAWRYHRVAADDTLASVAREFHVSESELADVNELRSTDSLQGVEALAIPLAPVAAPSSRMVLYTARRGDTLVTIADRFGVSLTQLRGWNKMTGIKVEPGQRLHVAGPAGASHATRGHRRETVAMAAVKTPGAASTKSAGQKGAGHKTGTAASSKNPASAGTGRKTASSGAAGKRAPSSHGAAAATKSAASGTKKKSANKQSARAKSSTQ
jgi:membrane-bound lytic murein transglycosylase D